MPNSSKLIKPVGQIGAVLLLTLAEAISDAFLMQETANYTSGDKNDNSVSNGNDFSWKFWLSSMLALLAAVPLAITMARLMFISDHHHIQHHEDPEQADHHHEQSHDDHKHDHHHSLPIQLLEFGIIGVPFGLLTFGGGINFFDKLRFGFASSCFTSTILALCNAYGNYTLHSTHIHAKEGFITLFKQIPTTGQRVKAAAFSASILLGHFFQGFLDAMVFLKSIGQDKNLAAVYPSCFILALIITIAEGNTEMRSMLLHEVNNIRNSMRDDNSGNTCSNILPKLILLAATALHAWQPTFGAAEFINFIYEQATHGESFAAAVPAWLKIALLGALAVVIGIPNGKGIFTATLPAFEKTYKTAAKTLIACKTKFFSCNNDSSAAERQPLNQRLSYA